MSQLHWDVVILSVAAVAYNLFALLYLPVFWRTQTGRALWIAMASMAALLDLSLAAFRFHWHVPMWLGTCVYILICLGGWLVLCAFIVEQFVKRRS